MERHAVQGLRFRPSQLTCGVSLAHAFFKLETRRQAAQRTKSRRMGQESIDYHAAEAILNSKRIAFFQPGTRLDRIFLEWCKTVDYGMAEIMSLFPELRVKDRLRCTCEVQCPRCKTWREEEYGRDMLSQLISFAKSGPDWPYAERFYCTLCLTTADRAKKRPSDRRNLNKRSAKQAEKAHKHTSEFLAKFLDPNISWNTEIPDANRFQQVTNEPVDESMLSKAIRQMRLEAFVNTPYWIAVRGEALRRAGGKCTLCGTLGKLTLRFRRPEWRGAVHTEEGLREILCLCGRCKNTHVLVSNSPN
jgi:hypothetical protein